MSTTTRLQVGHRLPALRFPEIGSGQLRPLRGGHREAVVVVALHDPACARCHAYLRTLAGAGDRFRIWDGRVQVVSASPPTPAPTPDPALSVLLDQDRELLDRVADEEGRQDGPVVVVADRYGQVYEILAAGAAHEAAAPRELEEWLQYLATQCPE